MTTETTIPEAPPATEPETTCPEHWQFIVVYKGRVVCSPVGEAPPTTVGQTPGVNYPTIMPGVDYPTDCADPLQQGFCAPLAPALPVPPSAASTTATVAVAPAQTLPMTGSGETIAIGLVGAVVLSAGLAMLRAARRPLP